MKWLTIMVLVIALAAAIVAPFTFGRAGAVVPPSLHTPPGYPNPLFAAGAHAAEDLDPLRGIPGSDAAMTVAPTPA